MNKCLSEHKISSFPGTVWAAGKIGVYPGPAKGREKGGPLTCVACPGRAGHPPPPQGCWCGAIRPCSPVVRIHDRKEEDVDPIPLLKNNLVCCWASQDLIRDIWPLQRGVVVEVMAADVVLGRTEVWPLAQRRGGPSHPQRCPTDGGAPLRVAACGSPNAHGGWGVQGQMLGGQVVCGLRGGWETLWLAARPLSFPPASGPFQAAGAAGFPEFHTVLSLGLGVTQALPVTRTIGVGG